VSCLLVSKCRASFRGRGVVLYRCLRVSKSQALVRFCDTTFRPRSDTQIFETLNRVYDTTLRRRMHVERMLDFLKPKAVVETGWRTNARLFETG